MTLEKCGMWWEDKKTKIQLATSDIHSGGFSREQAEEIFAQLKGTGFRNGAFTHKKVKIGEREVYVALYGYSSVSGSVEIPYIKRDGKYLYELTGNPSEILHFCEAK